ncbi:hypothetical protein [Modicisalibacter xianhensis]|nr:hypothetical protein [Halomonas xianhensis]
MKTSSGSLTVELQDQSDIDALWLLAGHVGGGPTTLRRRFSNGLGDEPGLFEQLDPYVSPLTRTGDDNGGVPRPRVMERLASNNYAQRVDGGLWFVAMDDEPKTEEEAAPLATGEIAEEA